MSVKLPPEELNLSLEKYLIFTSQKGTAASDGVF